jgi:WD40 repeat protein
MHPNGRWLGITMPDGFGIWDLTNYRQVAFIAEKFHEGYLLFEPSGHLLALPMRGLVRWPVKEDAGAPGGLVIGPAEPLDSPGGQSMSLNRDGSVIVTCNRALMGQEARAGGWIHHGGRMDNPIRIATGADVTRIAVDPGGKWVVTATHAMGNAKLWDAADGTFVRTLVERNASLDVIYFSSDGQWLSMSHDGGRVLSTKTWEPGPPVGKAAVFSPDGRMVAVQAPTGVRLVEHTTGREIALLEDPHSYSPRLNLFSLDGTKLISVNHERGIYVWDLKLIRAQLKARGLDWDWPEF